MVFESLPLRDLMALQPGAVDFWMVAPATNALPRMPDFVFGPLPDRFSDIYFRYSHLWAIGVYRARGIDLLGGYTMMRDGAFLCCPDANIHPAHQADFVMKFGDLARPRQRLFIPGQAVILAGPGYDVYGHWLSDFLPKLYVLHAAGVDLFGMKVLLPNDVPRFGLAWLELLGIPSENLIRYDPIGQVPWVEELLVPTTLHNGVRMAPVLRQSADLLKRMIARPVDGPLPPTASRRVFLSRGQAPANRMFRDRQRVEEQAERAGMSVVHPQNMPLAEQVRLFQNVSLVIGEYGSALHNTMFSPPGTIVCALRGSLRHPGFIQSGMGHALDQPTGYVFGRNESDEMNSDFTVPEEAFAECLDLIANIGVVDTFPMPV
jgi:capsular polysaccharide biosynthesis protein